MNAPAPHSYFDHSSEAQARRGRKKGITRGKLAQRFVEDLHELWLEQGESALRRAAFHDPLGFVSVVARLLPQKIEVTHPTDGMSDERLAELLDMAERMAALRASGVNIIDVTPNHEKAALLASPEEGGGGPIGSVDAGGEGCPSTPRDASADHIDETSNKLVVPSVPTETQRLIDEEAGYAIHPPVGRPGPELDHVVEKRNIQKLTEDVDPESLF